MVYKDFGCKAIQCYARMGARQAVAVMREAVVGPSCYARGSV
jgi:hypothetical protein